MIGTTWSVRRGRIERSIILANQIAELGDEVVRIMTKLAELKAEQARLLHEEAAQLDKEMPR